MSVLEVSTHEVCSILLSSSTEFIKHNFWCILHGDHSDSIAQHLVRIYLRISISFRLINFAVFEEKNSLQKDSPTSNRIVDKNYFLYQHDDITALHHVGF